MTNEEYAVLKQWHEMHPKQKMASPFPATEIMQRLIDAGFMEQITRSDVDSKITVVIGYDVTVAGESALKQHQNSGMPAK